MKKNLGTYIIIDYNNSSKQWGVGNSMNKKIYSFYNKSLIKVENYNYIKHKHYIKQGVFIKDKTAGTSQPTETTKVPVLKQALAQIEIIRRIA